MVQINLTRDEADALNALDIHALEKLIEQCIYEERTIEIYRLGLSHCGLYVSSKLREFERALASWRSAKSTKKKEDTKTSLTRAGRDLIFAIEQMQRRAITEKEEGQFFHIDDEVSPPLFPFKNMTVQIYYEWRRSTEDKWTRSSITFSYTSDFHPSYSATKPSAAKQRREREAALLSEWEYLRNLALCSIRDFFKSGGDGAEIPITFEVKTSQPRGSLNNYSADFWRERGSEG